MPFFFYKYPCKYSNLGLKWKETAEKENMQQLIDAGSS